MPTPTERFALDTYDPGESWDHTDTVQFLDEIAVARDTVANRPTSGTYDGEIFFATDEEIFYQWDATNTQWNEVLNAPTQAEFDSHSTRHERGGADEIPLNNLDLPAGAQIDEDGGELVIRDSGGSIVLRRDEGAGTWDFVSGDLTGIASLEAASLTIESGTRIGQMLMGGYQFSGTTTFASFSQTILEGIVQWDQIFPSGATIKITVGANASDGGDQIDVRFRNKTDGEDIFVISNYGSSARTDTFTYQPTTTSGPINLELQIRNSDGATEVELFNPTITFAIEA